MIVTLQPNQPSHHYRPDSHHDKHQLRPLVLRGSFESLKENIGSSLTISRDSTSVSTR